MKQKKAIYTDIQRQREKFSYTTAATKPKTTTTAAQRNVAEANKQADGLAEGGSES